MLIMLLSTVTRWSNVRYPRRFAPRHLVSVAHEGVSTRAHFATSKEGTDLDPKQVSRQSDSPSLVWHISAGAQARRSKFSPVGHAPHGAKIGHTWHHFDPPGPGGPEERISRRRRLEQTIIAQHPRPYNTENFPQRSPALVFFGRLGNPNLYMVSCRASRRLFRRPRVPLVGHHVA